MYEHACVGPKDIVRAPWGQANWRGCCRAFGLDPSRSSFAGPDRGGRSCHLITFICGGRPA
eukprot:5020298-Lingulodinium_polyedra.AAC.1